MSGTLSHDIVLLTVKLGLNSEDNLYRGRDCLQFSMKNLSSVEPFLLLESREVLAFPYFVGGQLEITFDDGCHRSVTDIHVPGHISYGPLWIPSYPLANCLNHLLCSSRTWSVERALVL